MKIISDIEKITQDTLISGPELALKRCEPHLNLGVEHIYGYVENVEETMVILKV